MSRADRRQRASRRKEGATWTRREEASIIAPTSNVPDSTSLSAHLFRQVTNSIDDSSESRTAGDMPPKKVGNDSSIERTEEYDKFLEELAAYHGKRGLVTWHAIGHEPNRSGY
jgi:hypothetical protein